MSWLDAFIVSYSTVQVAGVALPHRSILNFASGASGSDSPSTQSTNISLSTSALVSGTGFWYSTSGTLGGSAVSLGGDVTPASLAGGVVKLTLSSIDNVTLPSPTTGVLQFASGALSWASPTPGGSNGQVWVNVSGTPAWTTLNNAGDVVATATAGEWQVQSITGASGNANVTATSVVLASGQTYPVTGAVQGVQTTNAAATNIATFTMANNTVCDFLITVVGRNTNNGGDCYRADGRVTYQRFGGGAPQAVGGSILVINNVSSGGGTNYSGPLIAVASNTIEVQVAGSGSTTVDWSATYQVQQVA